LYHRFSLFIMDAKSTKNNRRTKINPIFLEKSFIIAKFVNYNELINNKYGRS